MNVHREWLFAMSIIAMKCLGIIMMCMIHNYRKGVFRCPCCSRVLLCNICKAEQRETIVFVDYCNQRSVNIIEWNDYETLFSCFALKPKYDMLKCHVISDIIPYHTIALYRSHKDKVKLWSVHGSDPNPCPSGVDIALSCVKAPNYPHTVFTLGTVIPLPLHFYNFWSVTSGGLTERALITLSGSQSRDRWNRGVLRRLFIKTALTRRPVHT